MANHHYTSQGHLRHFIHPTSTQNVLYPYGKGVGQKKPKGTKKLASAPDFYVQQEAGERHAKLEDGRSKAETLIFASDPAKPGTLHQCITNKSFTVDLAKAIDLASAAAFLQCGSPVAIHNSAMIGLVSHQICAFNQLNTGAARTVYQESHGNRAEEQIEAERDALLSGQLFLDVGEENWRQFGFDAYKAVDIWVRGLLSMKLTIVEAHGNDFFITGDSPVVVHSHSQPDNPGIALEDATVWFPISYERGLLWHHGKHPPREVFSTRETRAKNQLMLKWCYRDIFSPLPDPWLDAAAKAETFDPCYGHYGTLNDVIGQSAPAFLPDGTPSGEVVNIIEALRRGRKVDALRI